MTTRIKLSLAVLTASAALMFAAALPAMALTASSTSAAVIKAIAKADTEIANRLTALNKLSARIQDIRNLTAADKTALTSEVQTQTNTMNTLKAKIDADTDAGTLKADMTSITDDYRIYALIIPQVQIIAAADRLQTIALDISAVASKLQTRITAAQSAGKDITALQASLTDLQSKVTDAQTQAQAAVSAVENLAPDQGDATKMAANTAALKQGRAALKTGQADVVAARKDAGTILKTIQSFHISATASSTPSAVVQ